MKALNGAHDVCPQCGKPMVVRFGKSVKFLGCSGYPDCKYTKPLEGESAPVLTERLCPTCGKPMLQRMSKRGPFLGCSGYPNCKTTMDFESARASEDA
jgi:DNA topoisomerase-1